MGSKPAVPKVLIIRVDGQKKQNPFKLSAVSNATHIISSWHSCLLLSKVTQDHHSSSSLTDPKLGSRILLSAAKVKATQCHLEYLECTYCNNTAKPVVRFFNKKYCQSKNLREATQGTHRVRDTARVD